MTEPLLFVGLSTIPSRFAELWRTVASLLAQGRAPDRIFVAVPRRYRRFDLPDLEARVARQLAPLARHPAVELVRCASDDGPGTKLLGSLDRMRAESARAGREFVVALVDDDMVYRPYLLETLLASVVDDPRSACSFYSWDTETAPSLRVAWGADGFAFAGAHLAGVEAFFDALVAREPRFVFQDDFWLSIFLRRKGLVVRDLRDRLREGDELIYTEHVAANVDALRALDGELDRGRLNESLANWFAAHWPLDDLP